LPVPSFLTTSFCISLHLPHNNQVQLKGPYHHFACLSLIYSIFIYVTLLTIISQSILER
ncbi:hypothetical protein LDENG_00177780, partial [Lucifuga dentata]